MPIPDILHRSIPDWITLIVVGILIWLAWIRTLYDYKWNVFIRSIFTERYIGKLMKEEIHILQKLFYALFLVFVISLGLYFYRSMQLKEIASVAGYTNFKLFAVICAGIIGLYILKLILLKLVGAIFNAQKELDEYINIVLLYNNVAGILLLPIVILLIWAPYTTIMLYVGGGILVLTYLYRILRGIGIGLSNRKLSKVYLFYYLCTLEICPMLIGIKIISKML